MYEQEAVDQEAKVNKMKDDNKDPYDIRKQVYSSLVLGNMFQCINFAGGGVVGVTEHDPRLPEETGSSLHGVGIFSGMQV